MAARRFQLKSVLMYTESYCDVVATLSPACQRCLFADFSADRVRKNGCVLGKGSLRQDFCEKTNGGTEIPTQKCTDVHRVILRRRRDAISGVPKVSLC